MTYRGTNCAKIASWGKGKSIYSIIFTTASDLMNDLKFTMSVINVTRIILYRYICYMLCNLIFKLAVGIVKLRDRCTYEKVIYMKKFIWMRKKLSFIKTLTIVRLLQISNEVIVYTYPFQQEQHLKYHRELFQTFWAVSSLLHSGELQTLCSCQKWINKNNALRKRLKISLISYQIICTHQA